MKEDLLKRLESLEVQYNPNPLIVLASTVSGETIKITMRECLERKDTSFIKVTAGADLRDLDSLLSRLKVSDLFSDGRSNISLHSLPTVK